MCFSAFEDELMEEYIPTFETKITFELCLRPITKESLPLATYSLCC